MKIISNLLKDEKDVFLVSTTALINETNPIIDRLMKDDSVDSVVMANSEGLPILTNIPLINASQYATGMRELGIMVQNAIMEIDPFNEALVFRVKSCNEEIMVVPHQEFSILVVQRESKRMKPESKNNK